MLQKRKLLTLALASAMAAVALPAAAQPYGHDNRHNNRYDNRYDNNRNGYHGRGDPYRHSDNRGRYGPQRYPRGVGPDHRWNRGDRLPPAYRHRQYVVNNWGAYHLSAPPRGYNWVQVGGDYALIAIATGVIAQLVLNN